jgi:hypothetical protein
MWPPRARPIRRRATDHHGGRASQHADRLRPVMNRWTAPACARKAKSETSLVAGQLHKPAGVRSQLVPFELNVDG